MATIADAVIPIEPVQAAGPNSSSQVAQAYQANLRLSESREASPSIVHSSGAALSARIRRAHRTSPQSRALRLTKPHTETQPRSAYLHKLLEELHQALRRAEALRRPVAGAEPSAAYVRFAARAYSLEMDVQKEITRLRAHGFSEQREWYA